MTMRRWGAWAAASAAAAFLLWSLKNLVLDSVSRRDLGWVPGPFAELEDLVFQFHFGIDLLVFLIAELPALLWRRRGGSPPETFGLAVAVPLLVFAPALIPKGYPEDRFIPFMLIFLGLLAALATALICVFVRPARDGD
jgi:hypothetical protein